MQIISLLAGSNKSYDHQLSSLAKALLASSCVIRGVWWSLAVTSGQVDTWSAFIQCSRTNGQKVMVLYENTQVVNITTSGTKKVWIAVDQAKLDDGSSNALDGSWIASIQTGASYPSGNYLPLASITGGVITDNRIFFDENSVLGVNIFWISSTGTDAYEITPTPGITELKVGQTYSFLADVPNTTDCSLKVNFITWSQTVAIKKRGNIDLANWDIGANCIVVGKFDGTNLQMTSMVATAPSVDIAALTEDTAPDMDNDFLVQLDISASGNKKFKMSRYKASDAQTKAQSSNTLFTTPANLGAIKKLNSLIFPLQSQILRSMVSVDWNHVTPNCVFSWDTWIDGIYMCLPYDTSSSPYGLQVQYFPCENWTIWTTPNYNTTPLQTWSSAAKWSCVKIWDYIYVWESATGGLARYDAITLANKVTMTVSGTGLTDQTTIWTDGTYLYNNSATGSSKKYSISWTTATFVSSVSFTSMQWWTLTDFVVSDWTYAYQWNSPNVITRWAIAWWAWTVIAQYVNPYSSSTSRIALWLLLDKLYWYLWLVCGDSAWARIVTYKL